MALHHPQLHPYSFFIAQIQLFINIYQIAQSWEFRELHARVTILRDTMGASMQMQGDSSSTDTQLQLAMNAINAKLGGKVPFEIVCLVMGVAYAGLSATMAVIVLVHLFETTPEHGYTFVFWGLFIAAGAIGGFGQYCAFKSFKSKIDYKLEYFTFSLLLTIIVEGGIMWDLLLDPNDNLIFILFIIPLFPLLINVYQYKLSVDYDQLFQKKDIFTEKLKQVTTRVG